MAKTPEPHPILETPRLRLRQFRKDDADAMHACHGDPETMRYWDRPVHTKRIETERAVRNSITCTPSYDRVWAVADAATDRCVGMVNYHDGNIRSRRAVTGYILAPAHQRLGSRSRRSRPCWISVSGRFVCIGFRRLSFRTTGRPARWPRAWGYNVRGWCATICGLAMSGSTICWMGCCLRSGIWRPWRGRRRRSWPDRFSLAL